MKKWKTPLGLFWSWTIGENLSQIGPAVFALELGEKSRRRRKIIIIIITREEVVAEATPGSSDEVEERLKMKERYECQVLLRFMKDVYFLS